MTAKAERLPVLNPFRFIKMDDTLAENINTWPTDRGFFYEHRRQWQYGDKYEHKRNYSDIVDIYIDTLASVELHMYDADGNEFVTTYSGIGVSGVAVPGNTVTVGGVDYTYNSVYISFKLSDIFIMVPSQRVYYIGLECVYDAGDRTKSTWYISEPIKVRKSGWPKTMLIDVTNEENDYDVMFEQFPVTGSFAGLKFRHRVEACISDEPAPAFTDTVFKDQEYSLQKLKSVPYRLFDLIIGPAPKYILDKINRALSCDTTLIDGNRYVKDEGASWSMVAASEYNLFSAKIRLQEYEHDGGTVFTNADDPDFDRYHDAYHDEYHD